MAIAEELVAGVVSSVLAVLLVEVYLWLRRRLRHRSLRWLLGTETCAVATPVSPRTDHPAGLLTTYDAIGLAHVLEACNRIGTVPVVTRSGESAENAPLDVVALGGPASNQVTATFLKAYCPGFEILEDQSTGTVSYRCGIRTFEHTPEETFAFLVRLAPKETGLPGTALIAWGHTAVATASAGYYLARYANSLRKVNKGSFFVAISVRWVLGYRSFDTRPIDLTAAAFTPPKMAPELTPDPKPSSPSPPLPEPPRPVSPARPARRLGGRSRVADALDEVNSASDLRSAYVASSPAPADDSSPASKPPADKPGKSTPARSKDT
jgi:hypothetical protein